MCGSPTSSDSHGPSAHLYVFAKYIQSVDGGNLAPLLQRRFFTAPYPLLNIGIETFQKQICSNDGNLAPPQTEQLSMLKRGCGDASSSHRRCLLCRWCKISSIHSMASRYRVFRLVDMAVHEEIFTLNQFFMQRIWYLVFVQKCWRFMDSSIPISIHMGLPYG